MRWLAGAAAFVMMAGVALGACGAPQGRHVRVATATPAELEAALQEDNVWYEFQPGDIIPVKLGFLGAMEGGAEGPVVFRAKRQFFFVMSKTGQMQISFDGKTYAGPNRSQSLIAVVPRKDGQGGELAWIIYMGESGDPQAELQQLIESSKQPGTNQPPAEPPTSEPPTSEPPTQAAAGEPQAP